MVRSTWDYHHRYDEFIAWIERVATLTAIRNEPSLLVWNAHKSYLGDLERRGVPIVPTLWARRGERRALSEVRESRGWNDVVLKPATGAASHNVTRVRADLASCAGGQARLDTMLRTEDVLVQPYFEAVASYGERALIFLDGRYSHAVVKKPFDRVLAIGDEPSSVVQATREEIDVASQAMAAVPGAPLYGRVRPAQRRHGSPTRQRSRADRARTLLGRVRAGATRVRRCHRARARDRLKSTAQPRRSRGFLPRENALGSLSRATWNPLVVPFHQ